MATNLMNIVESGDIAKTGAKPKLPTTIPKLTDTMLDVYRIPLKYLWEPLKTPVEHLERQIYL